MLDSMATPRSCGDGMFGFSMHTGLWVITPEMRNQCWV